MTATESVPSFLLDLRREQRVAFTSLIFPFLGSRDTDHAFFQYLPIDFSSEGLQIIIPKWVVNRDRLLKGDRINLHVPFRLGDSVYSEAIVVWTRWDEKEGGQRCGMAMDQEVMLHYPIFIEFGATSNIDLNLQNFKSPGSLFLHLVKDSVLLKKGVRIYLKHLAAYFSRIVKVPPGDYNQLKILLFEDLDNQIKMNQVKLEALFERARNEKNLETEMARYVDLEDLRQMIESEIYIEVLKSALATETAMPLLQAIKTLEIKQYTNYNAIVMLYVYSL